MFSPASITEVLPGFPSQPSHVGAYSTVVYAPVGGPAYGRMGASCGRPTSTMSLSSTPTSASAYRSRAAGPATHTSSYAFAYGLQEDSLSLSPWLMKACLMVGMRSTWEVFAAFAGCSII